MLSSIVLLGVFLILWRVAMWIKDMGQRRIDAERRWYKLVFPIDMDVKLIYAFIRRIGSSLNRGSPLSGRPTICFEVRANPGGITYLLGLPKNDADYLSIQLQGAIEGIEINEITISPDYAGLQELSKQHGKAVDSFTHNFQYGATLHMHNYMEELSIVEPSEFSKGIISVLENAIQPGDEVCISWIISHSNNQKLPPSDAKNINRDSLKSQRAKQLDQNYKAVCRIAARGGEHFANSSKMVDNRAKQLVQQIVRAYTSERGSAFFYPKVASPSKISRDIADAYTPLAMTSQLNVKELGAVIAWPPDSSYIAGLERRVMRDLPAPESVPRQGIVIGQSSMPGIERPIAISYDKAVTHVYVGGTTEVGKTTLMVNMLRQVMDNGCGVIVIERDGNLYQQALNQVPPHRVKDAICIDLTRADRPIGLNLLRLNKPEIVAGQLDTLFKTLYEDSLYATQLLQHGIPVLANLERATIADLIPLVHPRDPVEKLWAKSAAENMTDKQYRDFWADWYKKDDKFIMQNSQPLKNRMWELLTPEATRYLLNQETSSFDPLDVIRGNKLLFVNLAGVSEQIASIIGTMLVMSIWSAAKQSQPSKPNFLVMDEMHQFAHLGDDTVNMFGEARKRNLGLIAATQNIERLKDNVQDAVMANARNKVVFTSSVKSAKIHAKDFADRRVDEKALINLKKHQAIARINTPAEGVSAPMTISTFPAPDGYGKGQDILDFSSARYGRDVQQIWDDENTRRVALKLPETAHKNIGRSAPETKGE